MSPTTSRSSSPSSIEKVYHTIGEAIVLVVLVIFLFLRSIRATLIPLVTIPVSLIGAFALMYAFGFTINTLTLLALVLAIGLVVDDAIVMLENIHRHVEEGMTPMKAAFKGSREIGFAMIAMTITLAAVYAPIALHDRQHRRLFTEFALTLAGAVIVSGFVALTLSPMMCSKLLRHQATHNVLYRASERVLRRDWPRDIARMLRRRAGDPSVGAFAGSGSLRELFPAAPAASPSWRRSRTRATSIDVPSRPRARPSNTPTLMPSSSRTIYRAVPEAERCSSWSATRGVHGDLGSCG